LLKIAGIVFLFFVLPQFETDGAGGGEAAVLFLNAAEGVDDF